MSATQTKAAEAGEVRLRLNGTDRSVPGGMTVQGLLEHLELTPALIVVERNLEILDRIAYGETPVMEGDRIELVHFVGGG